MCQLHAIAAKDEALQWGRFRSGGVTISGTDYQPPLASSLDKHWFELVQSAKAITNIIDRAITVFLTMARTQFFYDVNKRMGRFMMNGILLSEGYPAINVPAKRQVEFNELMINFYNTADMNPMNVFLRSCVPAAVIEIMME